ncbi:MAG TPA: efflux RND transporter periplasmic adaptor subunit [Ignavibacteria bacterium]|nr:efflux RND transporter periplasmic adaptor subunit [Ignavibacteria bacterium]HMR40519.1 efflux RND transporter periplasmic adaptor subunit [Ignavibacteria bacterium]
MNKPVRNISVILILIVIAALLIIPKLLSENNSNQEGSGRGNKDQEVSADAFIVRPTELENEILTSGTIYANEEVQIRSELTRKITGIYFKEGGFVPAGKVMFKLDDSDILARLRKLDLDEELNLKQQEREQTLLDKGLLTQEEFDVRQTNIEKIRADIEVLEVELDKTSITAPFSGIAGFRNVSIGSLVNNTVILTTVQDIGKVKIDFSIPEKFISVFKPGQTINYKVEGYDEEFTGTVSSFDPRINEATRSIVVRAVSGNKGNRLLPGSFVKVKLNLENTSDAIMIPTQAVIPKLKGQNVYVFENGIAVSKDVETGVRTDKEIQITSGLKSGDTIITTNILRLKPNSKIKIIKID